MSLKKIKRAIISVSDKSSLEIILPVLKKFKVEIISSGGSYKKIKSMNYDCDEVSKYTGLVEMLDGRVKTLHPKIYAGILNIRDNKKHQRSLKKFKIPSIDLVIVNFYQFEKNLRQNSNIKNLIENIDIGGPALVRSAAKNFYDVAIISDPVDYLKFAEEIKLNKGSTTLKFRELMSAKAFGNTAYYDSVISNWLNKKNGIKFPETKIIYGKFKEKLRYGENPHQEGGLYENYDGLGIKQLQGKKISFNNYNDIYSALSITRSFKQKSTAIIKHANPCGVSQETNSFNSFKNAQKCDPISAFGGVVAINSTVTEKLATELNKNFFEVIIANNYNDKALKILKRKKNTILIKNNKIKTDKSEHYICLGNSFLIQDSDNIAIDRKNFKIVTRKKPSKNQMNSLEFAFNICKFVKSNAVILANGRSIIGIGSGQPNRLDSCRIATRKAMEFMPDKISGCVAASDAFFPFADGVEELINFGVEAIIQPGGSIRDKEIISTANKFGITMILTGTRHFRH